MQTINTPQEAAEALAERLAEIVSPDRINSHPDDITAVNAILSDLAGRPVRVVYST